jgi:hypothetical protein
MAAEEPAEGGSPFRALVLLFLPTFFLLLLPQGAGKPATASSFFYAALGRQPPSSAAGGCSAQLFTDAVLAQQQQQQQKQGANPPQPALTLLSSGAAATCLLLTLPQRPAQPTACRQTVSGTWPDDFELRLGRADSATESRALPAATLLRLLPGSSAAASHYSVALPGALLQAFAAGAPAAPASAAAAAAAAAPLILDLYVYSSAYDWEVQAGEPCSPNSARAALDIGRATLELPPPAPLPPATQQQQQQQQQQQPLPRCTSASAPGRWLPGAAAAALPRGPGLGPSGEGWFWVGDDLGCAMRPFSGAQAQACLAARFPPSSLLLYLGDSNIRRDYKTLKGLLAAGDSNHSAWCAARRSDAVCLCSDSEETGEYDGNFGASFSASAGGFGAQYFLIPGVHPAGESEMSTWRPVLFDNILSLVRAGQRVGAIVFTLVHWEVAFDEYSGYTAELEAFAAALGDLAEEYERAAAAAAAAAGGGEDPPQPLLFVYRRPNYLQFKASPGAGAELGRFETHGLASLFARAADEALARALGGRLLVWDVEAVQHGKPWEAWRAHHDQCQDLGRSQHPASEDHEVALQLLLHGLCAGVDEGV